MKKGILLAARVSKDKKTDENLCWVTIGVLPSKMTKGGLFYPKKEDSILTVPFGELRNPDMYVACQSIRLGSLVGVTFDFNEIVNRAFPARIDTIVESCYSDEEMFD